MQVVYAYRACDFAAPGELVPLPRRVPAEVDPVAAAIAVTLQGVNEEERARGCSSFLSSRTEGALIGVHRAPGGDTIIVDFHDFTNALPDAPGVKSFLPPGVMAELMWTIFHQFPDIEAARFSFDGDEQAFWAWLRGAGTPARAFTRTMWERI